MAILQTNLARFYYSQNNIIKIDDKEYHYTDKIDLKRPTYLSTSLHMELVKKCVYKAKGLGTQIKCVLTKIKNPQGISQDIIYFKCKDSVYNKFLMDAGDRLHKQHPAGIPPLEKFLHQNRVSADGKKIKIKKDLAAKENQPSRLAATEAKAKQSKRPRLPLQPRLNPNLNRMTVREAAAILVDIKEEAEAFKALSASRYFVHSQIAAAKARKDSPSAQLSIAAPAPLAKPSK